LDFPISGLLLDRDDYRFLPRSDPIIQHWIQRRRINSPPLLMPRQLQLRTHRLHSQLVLLLLVLEAAFYGVCHVVVDRGFSAHWVGVEVVPLRLLLVTIVCQQGLFKLILRSLPRHLLILNNSPKRPSISPRRRRIKRNNILAIRPLHILIRLRKIRFPCIVVALTLAHDRHNTAVRHPLDALRRQVQVDLVVQFEGAERRPLIVLALGVG